MCVCVTGSRVSYVGTRLRACQIVSDAYDYSQTRGGDRLFHSYKNNVVGRNGGGDRYARALIIVFYPYGEVFQIKNYRRILHYLFGFLVSLEEIDPNAQISRLNKI